MECSITWAMECAKPPRNPTIVKSTQTQPIRNTSTTKKTVSHHNTSHQSNNPTNHQPKKPPPITNQKKPPPITNQKNRITPQYIPPIKQPNQSATKKTATNHQPKKIATNHTTDPNILQNTLRRPINPFPTFNLFHSFPLLPFHFLSFPKYLQFLEGCDERWIFWECMGPCN